MGLYSEGWHSKQCWWDFEINAYGVVRHIVGLNPAGSKLRCYFNATLYKDVQFGIEPATATSNMFSCEGWHSRQWWWDFEINAYGVVRRIVGLNPTGSKLRILSYVSATSDEEAAAKAAAINVDSGGRQCADFDWSQWQFPGLLSKILRVIRHSF
ncbi:Protein arginine N-methyltransferase 5 [Castilleja foliolosa]|uniref:Protein arginine N-methyltransferase 5 n=1 Tax=Castilleja foliolosa TaxID=1961234 RepID=A0ABD3CB13_9LAMI